MSFARFLATLVCGGLSASLPAAASHLVTGNGFGFAVVAPETGTVNKFYAHPYSFVRPDPRNPLSEGVETANFIKELGWRSGDRAAADHNIIPEMYVAVPCQLFPGKIGDPTGALPMVGYGAGEYILHVFERESLGSNH